VIRVRIQTENAKTRRPKSSCHHLQADWHVQSSAAVAPVRQWLKPPLLYLYRAEPLTRLSSHSLPCSSLQPSALFPWPSSSSIWCPCCFSFRTGLPGLELCLPLVGLGFGTQELLPQRAGDFPIHFFLSMEMQIGSPSVVLCCTWWSRGRRRPPLGMTRGPGVKVEALEFAESVLNFKNS
jgi:hypothetical protein